MSKLRAKIANLFKAADIIDGNFEIIGYNTGKGVNIVYLLRTEDEEVKRKILSNSLTEGERNFLISSVGEYFENQIKTDEKLFKYAVADIVVFYVDGEMDLPDGLLNKEFLDSCARKNQKTKEMIFNKNKFNGMPLNEKINVLADPMGFFDYVYGEDYRSSNMDIKYLVTLEDDTSLEDLNDEE